MYTSNSPTLVDGLEWPQIARYVLSLWSRKHKAPIPQTMEDIIVDYADKIRADLATVNLQVFQLSRYKEAVTLYKQVSHPSWHSCRVGHWVTKVERSLLFNLPEKEEEKESIYDNTMSKQSIRMRIDNTQHSSIVLGVVNYAFMKRFKRMNDVLSSR